MFVSFRSFPNPLQAITDREFEYKARRCELCGGSFFPSSLKFHYKECAKKETYIKTECPQCNLSVLRSDLARHLENCPFTGHNGAQRRESERSRGSARSQSSCGVGSTPPTAKLTRDRPKGAKISVSLPAVKTRNAICSSLDAVSPVDPLPLSPDTPPERLTAFPDGAVMGPGGSEGLLPCSHCGRSFLPERIDKHEKICSTTGKQQRFPFSSAEQRLSEFSGVERMLARPIAPRRPQQMRRVVLLQPHPAELLQPRLRVDYGRPYSDGVAHGATSHNPQHVGLGVLPTRFGMTSRCARVPCRCPHCLRVFPSDVAAHHIPFCRSTFRTPKPPARLPPYTPCTQSSTTPLGGDLCLVSSISIPGHPGGKRRGRQYTGLVVRRAGSHPVRAAMESPGLQVHSWGAPAEMLASADSASTEVHHPLRGAHGNAGVSRMQILMG
ncbi:hypothetical protein CYMTET_56457 [Cymbomonas tetramitiformis]|uniref:C2HC/C3H-type domain-containing protein n=1 Tax=Cymbomonas tetramitiformis TaxID=36881 RepID=A0AAE0BAV7_9CHLO|nr:hypothetical protein CYMTET_56457 [Cymbomonas tetramitiformis]